MREPIGDLTMNTIISAISIVTAVCAIMGFILHPTGAKWYLLVIVLDILSLATATYTPRTMGIVIVSFAILFLVFGTKSYAKYEKIIVNSQVYFSRRSENDPSKSDLFSMVRDLRQAKAGKVHGPIKIASGMEYLARKGVEFESSGDILKSGMLLAVALDIRLVDSLEVIRLLINGSRKPSRQAERMADMVTVAAQRGLDPLSLIEILKGFLKTVIQPWGFQVEEILAIFVTLTRSEFSPEEIGQSVALVVNRLIEIQRMDQLQNEIDKIIRHKNN